MNQSDKRFAKAMLRHNRAQYYSHDQLQQVNQQDGGDEVEKDNKNNHHKPFSSLTKLPNVWMWKNSNS